MKIHDIDCDLDDDCTCEMRHNEDMKLEIDDTSIVKLLQDRKEPITFSEIIGRLRLHSHDRMLDKALQRLRKAGVIRYQPKSPGSGYEKQGWVLCSRRKFE